ncbi:carbohydrate-binding family 9-like protein [Maribellus sediminis]|uniref:carbohydrate-binding family 9-like protein n=1 Tax=Maribellus sediminis TaxID=2696285 RepID=UPI001430E552|nr:carbohydrate-binding family 9-like protein [Maribellus sediminis]
MQKLIIPKIASDKTIQLEKAANLLEENGQLEKIETINWPDYPYKPDLKFRIAHSDDEIWLKFYVREKYIRGLETRTNGDVYKDSTVEFFIALNDDNYYNFEFSCIGTIHIGYGPGRGNRLPVDPETAEKIEIKSSLGNQPFEEKQGDFSWEMMVRIPITCFAFDNLNTLDGLRAKANFYKCGDETTEPHFVSWNPIKTETPDYHRPEFFADIKFE